MSDQELYRVFFGLQPEFETAQKMANDFQRLGSIGNPVKPSNLHVTLYFLGEIHFDKVQCVIDRAEEVEANAIDLHLNRFSYFSGSHIMTLVEKGHNEALHHLYSELGKRISTCRVRLEKKTYEPHLTLARKAEPLLEPPIADYPLRFENFSLMRSRMGSQGPNYEVIKSFPLSAEPLKPCSAAAL